VGALVVGDRLPLILPIEEGLFVGVVEGVVVLEYVLISYYDYASTNSICIFPLSGSLDRRVAGY